MIMVNQWCFICQKYWIVELNCQNTRIGLTKLDVLFTPINHTHKLSSGLDGNLPCWVSRS